MTRLRGQRRLYNKTLRDEISKCPKVFENYDYLNLVTFFCHVVGLPFANFFFGLLDTAKPSDFVLLVKSFIIFVIFVSTGYAQSVIFITDERGGQSGFRECFC